jgi:flagellar export protein FliJ
MTESMSKGFRFSLQSVLRLKEQQQQQAELQLSRLRLRLDATRAELDAISRQLGELADYIALSIDHTRDRELQWTHHNFASRLRSKLRSVQLGLAEIQSEYDRSLCRRNSLAQEVEALGTLKTSLLQNYRKQQNRRSLRTVDENVMRNWMANASRGENH